MEKKEVSQIGKHDEESLQNNIRQMRQNLPNDFQQVLQTLPKETFKNGLELYNYQGYWYPAVVLKSVISFQTQFQARDSDLILATSPKSGTTWLKALSFTIVNRDKYSLAHSPLLSSNPHDLVPLLDHHRDAKDMISRLEGMSSPRLLSTHQPHSSLPLSIRDSKCLIVYLCRNPLDQFISYWIFLNKLLPIASTGMDSITMNESFDMYCRGVHPNGPFWDHALGYWKASQETPEKVLFLKYEDMIEDTTSHLKKLAEFLGFPFSVDEEEQGVVEAISNFCSFENIANLEVNKIETRQYGHAGLSNAAYFRKGRVGDWANYLTSSMAERLKKVMDEKFGGSGLIFKVSNGC